MQVYLDAVSAEVQAAFEDDLLGVWLIGSAAQWAYEPGTSDLDVLAVTGSRHPESLRRTLGERVRHPALECPAVGLEFVVYARPDVVDLADPVRFALNVNGGRSRDDLLALGPDDGPGWWAVLDLAAARVVGVPLHGPAPDVVIPAVPAARLRAAVAESQAWHDRDDATSTNRALNIARLIVLLTDGRWLSKSAGATALADAEPDLAPTLNAALAARATGAPLDPNLAAPLSARLAVLLRESAS